MDFNNRDYLEFVLLSLYRHIARAKGATTAQVKVVIEKKWGPFQYVLDELIPLPEVECSPIQLKLRIKSCFQEAADQDVDMHEYHKLWKSLTWQPMPRKRKLSEKEKAEKEQVRAAFERISKKPTLDSPVKTEHKSAKEIGEVLKTSLLKVLKSPIV